MAYSNIYTFHRVQCILNCIFTPQSEQLPPLKWGQPCAKVDETIENIEEILIFLDYTSEMGQLPPPPQYNVDLFSK